MVIRILVVDNDKQNVRLVRSCLEQAGMMTFPAYNGEEALHFLRAERPDFVILELILPERSGWEITRLLRNDKHLNGIPILILTAQAEDANKLLGFEAGADDYLTKPFNPREVVARVQAILRRVNRMLSERHVLEVNGLRLDMDYRTVTIDGQPVTITPTQFILLQCLMENPNRVFTRADLIQHVFGNAYRSMERTMDAHIKNLRKRIEVDPARPRYIETVYGVGYCLREK